MAADERGGPEDARERIARVMGLVAVGDGVRDPVEIAREEDRRARASWLEGLQADITPEDRRALYRQTLDETEPLELARWFLDGGNGDKPMRFLALVGERGRGKTVAAIWTLLERARRMRVPGIAWSAGVFMTAPELRELATSNEPKDRELLHRYMRAHTLVVDDLGTEAIDKRTEEIWNRLIGARQSDARARTILTSNLDEAAVVERYGVRVVDRIRHQGAVVQVEGPNLRRR